MVKAVVPDVGADAVVGLMTIGMYYPALNVRTPPLLQTVFKT